MLPEYAQTAAKDFLASDKSRMTFLSTRTRTTRTSCLINLRTPLGVVHR